MTVTLSYTNTIKYQLIGIQPTDLSIKLLPLCVDILGRKMIITRQACVRCLLNTVAATSPCPGKALGSIQIQIQTDVHVNSAAPPFLQFCFPWFQLPSSVVVVA